MTSSDKIIGMTSSDKIIDMMNARNCCKMCVELTERHYENKLTEKI